MIELMRIVILSCQMGGNVNLQITEYYHYKCQQKRVNCIVNNYYDGIGGQASDAILLQKCLKEK